MAINTETIMPIGMNRDALIGTGNSDKYAFENLNLRYIASEDGTTGSWTVEKSTKEERTSDNKSVLPTGANVLGQAVINDTLVLFIKNSNYDYIIKVYYIGDTISAKTLYQGDLNFSKKIETTTSYENENIQKVYWVDGINPLRMINISRVKASSNFDTQFDVLPKLNLEEQVTIEKCYNGSGMFPSGTTQYFFTYVDKYGRESNIFYASSLYYNSLKDRGLNPDGSEYASCSYKINITHLDTANMFDYVRIYSVIRPMEGATPIARIIVDLDLVKPKDEREDAIFYEDTNTTGEIIDYTTLMFLGGKPIIPSTLEQKNNTLFLGNLKLANDYILTSDFKKDLKTATTLTFERPNKVNTDASYMIEDYPFNKALDFSADDITTYKKGITYRFAVQFQDYFGNWSEAIYLGDVLNDKSNTSSKRVIAKATINFNTLNNNYSNLLSHFKKVRLLCTYPTISDKEIVAQGVLCPTMFHPAWEKVHAPDRFSSWFFRPENGTGPLSRPTLQASETIQEAITITGDCSAKIEVNSTLENWNAYDTATDSILKVTINNKALNKSFFVYYTHGTTDNVKYVQATIKIVIFALGNNTIKDIYNIKLYQNDPYTLHYEPCEGCDIYTDTFKNKTVANFTFQIVGNKHFFRSTYNNNSPYVEVSDDIFNDGQNTYYGKKVSYKYMVANTYEVSSSSEEYDLVKMLVYDYKESIGAQPDLDKNFQEIINRHYYYYDSEVSGGYGWNTEGRVTKEVQSADSPVTVPSTKDDWGFYVDTKDYFTFHSPDVEYNESLQTTNIQDCKLSIIGQVNQTAWCAGIDIDASTGKDYNGNTGEGLVIDHDKSRYHYTPETASTIKDVNTEFAVWRDIDVYASNAITNEHFKQIDYYQYDYQIYPFHRRFLNNYVRDVDIPLADTVAYNTDITTTIKMSGEIKHKCFGTYRVFGDNVLYDTSYNTIDPVNATFFVDNSYLPIRIKQGSNVIKYNGTVDDIAEPYRDSDEQQKSLICKYDGLFTQLSGSSLNVLKHATVTEGTNQQTTDELLTLKGAYPILANYKKRSQNTKGWIETFLAVDSEGPQIRFKSNTHIVLNLGEITDWPTRQTELPSLYLAELTRTVVNRYGGNSTTALKNNIFYPCGMPKTITFDNNFSLYGTRGDCYYMSYDCLKTYPYSNEERNGIVEIASFNCESYINLNGRYDKYIGQMTDITNLDKTKFGLINLGYTQNKDFFSYHIIDDDDTNLNNYPNQITWTKTKTPGEIVDTWTNITLANVANAEGTMGAITSLSIFNDTLLMFQEHGIAQLGYNEKTAISTENGLPLEIASSNKFTGFAYLSKEIGCQNKWSINTSKNGIMFIDSSRKELNIVGENIISLSTKHGFDHFFIKELEVDDNFTTYYDKLSKDIYYLNSRCCLAFNEVSGTFTSFYNYEGITALATISNHSIVAKNDSIWALREGNNYSNYFNEDKPYKMVVCCDGGKYFQADKVFNTVETRSDVFNPDSINSTVDENPFDTIAAWTSYQKPVDFSLDGTDPLYEWSAVRKYNIWRYIVPRATYNDSTITRDRIRNPFAFIKLERKLPRGNRAIIHDMVISYDIK